VAIRGRHAPKHPMTCSPAATDPHRIAPSPRSTPGLVHRSLRSATRTDHAELDGLLLRLDLGRKADYGLFLHIHFSALQDLEADWRAEDREDFGAMLKCLSADLQLLGAAASRVHSRARTPGLRSNRLGVAYVIRGSRLGAAHLRRTVPNTFPTVYLDFVPRLSWSRFLQQLDEIPPAANTHGNPDDARDDTRDAVEGARIAFAAFAHRGSQALS
jgi:heme oxygenase (biliverdin-IX-beta and delta-forming)